MKISTYRKTVFSWKMLKNISTSFFAIFGIFALFLSVADILWPNKLNQGALGLGLLLIISFIFSVIKSWPKMAIIRQFSEPDTKITIKIGNLLEEDCNLIIGFPDTFDTEIGKIISQESLHGQFLSKLYGNDKRKLDSDLKKALSGYTGIIDNAKKVGKNKRFPIGTTAVLNNGTRKYFCCAYACMGLDCKAISDVDSIRCSLHKLWESVRINGEQLKISMPVIGADFARVAGVSHSTLIKIILLSYITEAKAQPITKELNIVVYYSNLEKINLLEIRDFLNNL